MNSLGPRIGGESGQRIAFEHREEMALSMRHALAKHRCLGRQEVGAGGFISFYEHRQLTYVRERWQEVSVPVRDEEREEKEKKKKRKKRSGPRCSLYWGLFFQLFEIVLLSPTSLNFQNGSNSSCQIFKLTPNFLKFYRFVLTLNFQNFQNLTFTLTKLMVFTFSQHANLLNIFSHKVICYSNICMCIYSSQMIYELCGWLKTCTV